MIHTFSHKFATPRGLLVHVPTAEGREAGRNIVRRILDVWQPPAYFFHFRDGGHVAACRSHLDGRYFARLDIESFFSSVTATKVHRALRRLGFRQNDAMEIVRLSTVQIAGDRRTFALPFGFVQSMVLASAALDLSHLGRCLNAANGNSVRLSVYVDDIIVSGQFEADVSTSVAHLAGAAATSRYRFNVAKTTTGTTAEAFNIRLATGSLLVTPQRMAKFAEAVDGQKYSEAIIQYVGTINGEQADILRSPLPRAIEMD
jgi:hypothetical protein